MQIYTVSPGADEPNQRAFTLTPWPVDNKASDEEAEVPLDIQSLQPELQDIAQSIMTRSLVVIPSTPNRPAANQTDEDFMEEPLDLNSLQPELQAIANSIPTKTSPAVRKLLLAAFKALQVETGSPSRSGLIEKLEAILIPSPRSHL